MLITLTRSSTTLAMLSGLPRVLFSVTRCSGYMASYAKCFVAASFALSVAACSSLSQPAPKITAPPVKQTQLASDAIRVDTTDARVARYWSAAEQARLDENYGAALDSLVTALEISPQNSLLWSRAAELQLDQQQPALAESYAVKSNTYAAGDARLLHRNWLIIEHARSIRGDLLGVRSAHKKVQEYLYRQ